MKTQWVIPVLAAGLCAGAVAVPAGTQPPPGKANSRQAAQAVFQKLRSQFGPNGLRTENDGTKWEERVIGGQKVKVVVGANAKKGVRVEPVDPMGIQLPPPVPGPGPGPGPAPGPTPGPAPAQLCVKVWAELSDDKGTQTNQFVPIEMYKWHPDERFYFWVESPVPVQLSLSQYYNISAAEAKDPKLVSPNPAFPNTYATVAPGQPFRFPQLFKCDHTQRDEFVTLTVIQAGAPVPAPPSPGQPPQPTPLPVNDPGTPANVPQAVLQQQTTLLTLLSQSTVLVRKEGTGVKLSYNKEKEPYRLETVPPVLPAGSSPTTYTSSDVSNVCLYALGSQTMGMLPLRFSK
jgi:hypothetical protein